MHVTRPTPERFDEVLAVLQAADVAVYGDTGWTETELRDEWAKLDLGHDAWLVELDGRVAGVAVASGSRSCTSRSAASA